MDLSCSLRRLPGGWWVDLGLLAGFCLVTVALCTSTQLIDFDIEVAAFCDAHRPTPAYVVARLLNLLGQGGPLTLLTFGVAAWRARTGRSARPLLVPAVTWLMVYAAVGPMKVFFARPAPHNPDTDHPERLFELAGAMSYPSGHVVNSLAWYAAITILLGRSLSSATRWGLRLAPVVLVVATTTYLGYHWLTDGLAGVFLGGLLVRGLLRIRWDTSPLPRFVIDRGWGGPAGLDSEAGPAHA